MTQLLNKTVAAIVLDNFKTAHVFEKYGIDFCCKGKISLQSACEEKAIDPTTVIEDLALVWTNTSDEAGFTTMSISALINHIVTVHHDYVRKNLEPILNYLLKIHAKHGERYPYIKKVLIYFSEISVDLEKHMRQEEKILFPLINDIANNKKYSNASSLESLIGIMEEEHNTAGTLMEKIRTVTDNYNMPDNACTTFRLTMNLLRDFESDLHRHVHLENHILFPKAIKLYYEQLPSREV
jgi:regulator of cell morphogenesis and NO signaling